MFLGLTNQQYFVSLLLFNAATCTRLNYMAGYYSVLDSRQGTSYALLITVPLTKYVNLSAPTFHRILYPMKNIDPCLETQLSRPGFSLNCTRKYMAGSLFFFWFSLEVKSPWVVFCTLSGPKLLAF